MRYRLFLPYTNNRACLDRALSTLQPWYDCIQILNNSEGPLEQLPLPLTIQHMPTFLTFTQMMNVIRQQAIGDRLDACLFMHSDALVRGDLSVFLEEVKGIAQKDHHWGIVFTKYDVLCAFNPRMLEFVGPWDTNLRQYNSDIDYYHRRMPAWGFTAHQSAFAAQVEHQEKASVTIRTDLVLRALNGWAQDAEHTHYIHKWGRLPHEPHDKTPSNDLPFNGSLALQVLSDLMLTPEWVKLTGLFHDGEGNLLEENRGPTLLAQVTLLIDLLRALAPRRVLEIGTNKGLFGLLLKYVLPNVKGLDTFDCKPYSRAVELLGPWCCFHEGDSRQTLTKWVDQRLSGVDEAGQRTAYDPIDFAWVDGGHDREPVTMDILNCNRLGVKVIAVDDCKSMPFIDEIIAETFYTEVRNPYYKLDDRGIRLFYHDDPSGLMGA